MPDKKTYPPVTILAGSVVELSAEDGVMELHGEYPEPVIEFVAAFADFMSTNERVDLMPHDKALFEIEIAKTRLAAAWEAMPALLLNKAVDKSNEPRLWIPGVGQ